MIDPARKATAEEAAHRLAPLLNLNRSMELSLAALLAAGEGGAMFEDLPGPLRRTSQVHVCFLRKRLGPGFKIETLREGGKRSAAEHAARRPSIGFVLSASAEAKLWTMLRDAPWRPPAAIKLNAQEEQLIVALKDAPGDGWLSTDTCLAALVAGGSKAKRSIIHAIIFGARRALGANAIERSGFSANARARFRLTDAGLEALGLQARGAGRAR